MKNANKKKQQTLLETFLSTKQEARPGEANNNDQVRPGEANNEIVDLCDSDDDSFSDSFPNKRHKKNNSNYINTTVSHPTLTASPLPLVGKTVSKRVTPEKSYKCEYSRFISAFLKPLVHETTKFTTTWVEIGFDPNSTAKISISADSVGKTITPALIERIARDCLDKDKYLTEKEFANGVAFGSHETKIGDQVEVDTFELKGNQKSLQLWWDKWFGRGSYPDEKGGVAGRNAKFEAKWRTNNPQRVPKTTYGHVNKIINKISDRVSAKLGETNKREYAQLDEEWHRIAEQEIIPEMEKEFQKYGASVKKFCKSDIFKN